MTSHTILLVRGCARSYSHVRLVPNGFVFFIPVNITYAFLHTNKSNSNDDAIAKPWPLLPRSDECVYLDYPQTLRLAQVAMWGSFESWHRCLTLMRFASCLSIDTPTLWVSSSPLPVSLLLKMSQSYSHITFWFMFVSQNECDWQRTKTAWPCVVSPSKEFHILR